MTDLPASSAAFPELTPQDACEALATVGLRLAPEQVRVERREERWLVRLPDDRMAWFAASLNGHRRLGAERRPPIWMGSQPDAWRYVREVQDAGKPADATGYR